MQAIDFGSVMGVPELQNIQSKNLSTTQAYGNNLADAVGGISDIIVGNRKAAKQKTADEKYAEIMARWETLGNSEPKRARNAAAQMSPYDRTASEALAKYAEQQEIQAAKPNERVSGSPDDIAKQQRVQLDNLLKLRNSPEFSKMARAEQLPILNAINNLREKVSSTEKGRLVTGYETEAKDIEIADPKLEQQWITANAIDSEPNGIIDNLAELKARIAGWQQSKGLSSSDAMVKSLNDYLDALVSSTKDNYEKTRGENVEKKDRGRASAKDAQLYAENVYNQINRNNAVELTALRSINSILQQVTGNPKSALNDYNTVKAALRATVPEAVNEGDIANIKNLQNGSIVATVLSKIGASQPLSDSDVESAAKGLVNMYGRSYSKINSSISDAISKEKTYPAEVKKQLTGILSGYPNTWNEGSGKGSSNGSTTKPVRKHYVRKL